MIGNALKFIFYPLGFGNWQATVAMLSSLMAKEAVVESLLMVSTSYQTLFYSQFSVYAFMAFLLLSPPCVAALATAKKELKSNKLLLFMIAFQFTTAYVVAFIINGTGFLINCSMGLLLSVILVIIILVAMVFTVRILIKRRKCSGCNACKKESKCTKRNTI
jgi:ferrous iron transport protein B